ncbi:MAG TPA: hypothetical protein VMV20_05160 [Chitinophagaceae bacterium]|nr:hypothetical protein [Chitinophagaceae bacterium]
MKLLLLVLLSGFSLGHGPKNGPTAKHPGTRIDSSKLEQCHYRFPDGTRCTELVWKPAKFCPRHRGS